MTLLLAAGPQPPAAVQPQDVRGQLAEARARAALAGERVFRSRLVVWFKGDVSGEVAAKELTVTVDGDPVFVGEAPLRGGDAARVFDMWMPAGRHRVGAKLVLSDYKEKGAEPRGIEQEVAGTVEVVNARERATVVVLTLEADGDVPSADREAAGEAKGELDARVRGKWRMAALKEADEQP